MIQDTAGWAWTAIQINGFGPTPGIDNVEIVENNSSGPGYVYVQGSVDFEDVNQWINMDAIIGTANADIIRGSGVADPTIQAGDGNDQVYGRGGDDIIYGENGNDVLDGGAGTNTLTGGAGADTFAVSTDDDHSTILDFVRGTDHIQFALSIADDFSDLTITDVAGDAHVAVGTVELTLAGIDHSLLDASDFLFV